MILYIYTNNFNICIKFSSIEVKYFNKKIYFRYVGAPVDFEVVDIDPDVDNDHDVQYAITTIKRNGVGIKVILICNSVCCDPLRNEGLLTERQLFRSWAVRSCTILIIYNFLFI